MLANNIMIKKTLSHGIKVLKLSTWISVVAALLVVLVVAFFVTFPALIKAPIEQQLSEFSELDISLSKISFDFNQDGLALNLHNFKVRSPQQGLPIAEVNHLQWDINLSSLLDDVYHPSEIFIDTLILYSDTDQNTNEFGVNQIRQLISPQSLEALYFFKSLSINKTLIKGSQTIEIAPMVLSRNEAQLSLSVVEQDLGFSLPDSQVGKANIIATLSTTQSNQNKALIIPLLISNDEFSVQSHLKIFNEHGNDFVEFNSYIEQMQASDVAKYLPAQALSDDTHAWIKRGFVSGKLEDTQFYLKRNLSTSTIVETRFDTNLKDMELLFNSDWNSLKQLDATLQTDGKKIVVMVHSTQLNEMALNDIKVQILDMSQPKLEAEVIGKINTQSEDLIEFLRRAPLSETVNEVLNQFTLTGDVTGDMKLVVPLDERESILDIDLVLDKNHLTTLNGGVVVEDYTSKLAFHNDEITATGAGNIRGMPFDIYINPDNRGDDNESTFGVELSDNSGLEVYITKRLNQSWRARVESESIKGNVEVVLNEGGNPSVKLLGLQVTTLDAIKGEWDITPNDFPSMYLSAQGVYIDENVLPNFSAELLSQDNMLTISNLQFDGVGVGDEMLSFNGFWVDGRTGLYANAKGNGLAEFLQKLKVKEKVAGGEFDFDIRLSCECTPWNMNYQDVTGYVAMKVKKGVFTEKDPNIGRILSLLNIKSIAKRLKLDVGDVTKEGFVYEDIDARIHISNALAKIDKFELNATSGVIRLTGQSHIINEEYEMMAKVSPAVGDAVPAATALAGGGAIGLGVWLIDEALFEGKLIDKIVDKVVDIEYKITGPWDNPTIE
ncbi:FIG006388: Possible exported protein [hydrothermal vent metagenome]|uniref:FIG006388: Possible exported protein n=1 Tax=hydrothermal vent metagenome TaxID=652676 RepID=A0A1W1DIG9_9ZZZZ